MKLKQAELKSKLDGSTMVCWINFEGLKLKEGVQIVLTCAEEEIWVIEKLYDTSIDHFEINRKWDVGGL